MLVIRVSRYHLLICCWVLLWRKRLSLGVRICLTGEITMRSVLKLARKPCCHARGKLQITEEYEQNHHLTFDITTTLLPHQHTWSFCTANVREGSFAPSSHPPPSLPTRRVASGSATQSIEKKSREAVLVYIYIYTKLDTKKSNSHTPSVIRRNIFFCNCPSRLRPTWAKPVWILKNTHFRS